MYSIQTSRRAPTAACGLHIGRRSQLGCGECMQHPVHRRLTEQEVWHRLLLRQWQRVFGAAGNARPSGFGRFTDTGSLSSCLRFRKRLERALTWPRRRPEAVHSIGLGALTRLAAPHRDGPYSPPHAPPHSFDGLLIHSLLTGRNVTAGFGVPLDFPGGRAGAVVSCREHACPESSHRIPPGRQLLQTCGVSPNTGGSIVGSVRSEAPIYKTVSCSRSI